MRVVNILFFYKFTYQEDVITTLVAGLSPFEDPQLLNPNGTPPRQLLR